MAVARRWDQSDVVIMTTQCRLCRIGAGVSLLASGHLFYHSQRSLNDDGLCDECTQFIADRRAAGKRPPRPDKPFEGWQPSVNPQEVSA